LCLCFLFFSIFYFGSDLGLFWVFGALGV
jgi:hypothetical protein